MHLINVIFKNTGSLSTHRSIFLKHFSCEDFAPRMNGNILTPQFAFRASVIMAKAEGGSIRALLHTVHLCLEQTLYKLVTAVDVRC